MTRIYTKGGTLNPAREEVYNILYEQYKIFYHSFKQADTKHTKTYLVRCLECAVEEAGIKGTKTKLISEKALASKVKDYRGERIYKEDSVSTEHPVTYRVIATYLLSRRRMVSKEYFFKFWLDHLITVKTTLSENLMLKAYQKDFKLGVDCWKEMYKKAGIKLVDDPNFKSYANKRKYCHA